MQDRCNAGYIGIRRKGKDGGGGERKGGGGAIEGEVL
jgi:hypothetical protein